MNYYKVRDYSGKFEKRSVKIKRLYWKTFMTALLMTFTYTSIWLFFGLLNENSYISPVEAQTTPTGANIAPQKDIKEYVFKEVERELGFDTAVSAVVMIATCENRGWDIEATLVNHGHGIDRGLWQINSKYHPEVSWECAYNLECSTKEAIRIIKERGLQEWTCGK